MEQLHELMHSRLQAAIDEGKLTDLMDKHIQEMMNNILRQQLSSYGDTAKAIEAKIKESMAGCIENVSFPEYSQYVSDLVVREYGSALNNQAAELFRKQIGEQLAPVPEEITADAFFSKLKDYLREHGGFDHCEVDMNWEVSDSAIYLRIGERHSDFKIVFYDFINRDKSGHAIGYIQDEGGHSLTVGVSGATYATHGIDSYLFRLYCTKTEITGLLDWEDSNLELFED